MPQQHRKQSQYGQWGTHQARGEQPTHPKDWQTPFPLPYNTANFVLKHQHDKDTQNLGLWLERFVTWRDQDDRGRDTSLSRTRKADRRESPMLKPTRDGLVEWQGEADLRAGLRKRWGYMLSTYAHLEHFSTFPEWRFVVGLGGANVLETSMTLHRLYGLPIIPGSALKGLARAYAEMVLGKAPDDPEVVAVFGKPPGSTPLETGEIIFFDAIPITSPKFKLDVMTPHFQKYYQGSSDPPADWQDPNPIHFLTVEKTQFLFAVAARREAGKDYVGQAKTWLEKGLAELGIGAKTAAGYGYFEEVR